MRFPSITLTCLCIVLTAIPAFATDKEVEKQMDPQAMMEMYKKLATPGNRTSCLPAWPGTGRPKPSPGWNPISHRWNPPAPRK